MNEATFPFFLILNIEALRMQRMVETRPAQGNKPAVMKKIYPIERELTGLIKDGIIGMVSVDEVHKNTSASSRQGRCLWRIHKATSQISCCWVPMTGTPLVNQPKDLFLPVGLSGGHDFSTAKKFEDYFCPNGGRTIAECRNLGELRVLLRGKMIRRTKIE